jgi:hypothetical protein
MASEFRVTTGRAFLLAAIPALLLARCGIWPSFPSELIEDAGATDARAEAGDAHADGDGATEGGDAASDVPSDVPPTMWNGFRACPAAPMERLMPEPAFSADGGSPLANITSPRDIAFDGQGNMLIVGRDAGALPTVFTVSATGVVRGIYTATQGFFFGARYLLDGHIILMGSFLPPMGMTTVQGITLLSGAGMLEGRLAFMGATPWGAVAHPNGNYLVLDSSEGQIFPFNAGSLPPSQPMAVNTSMAMSPPPLGQRAAAFSADYRRLYVVSQMNGIVHEFEVSESGEVNGASRRVFHNFGDTAAPRSLAFDECGNMYVAISIPGGPSRGGIARLPPRGGTPFIVATFDLVDAQRTIAFGMGPGFSDTSLYVADSSSSVVSRIDIGIRGQPVVVPSMRMIRDM